MPISYHRSRFPPHSVVPAAPRRFFGPKSSATNIAGQHSRPRRNAPISSSCCVWECGAEKTHVLGGARDINVADGRAASELSLNGLSAATGTARITPHDIESACTPLLQPTPPFRRAPRWVSRTGLSRDATHSTAYFSNTRALHTLQRLLCSRLSSPSASCHSSLTCNLSVGHHFHPVMGFTYLQRVILASKLALGSLLIAG